jgi:YebC/PmpR family DNA-binding regulatory protein
MEWAMGRTFENRKHAIAKRGARDAKAFTKAGRQISMAVRAGGPDPDANPALRRAIQNARAVSMPKDKILSAIEKASGANTGDDYQEILYEGYGPHGVAILVTTTTDNPTRTVANVRSYFKKGGGALGTAGSVAFLFDQFGSFFVEPGALDRDELELELIDAGLERLEDGTTDDGKSAWIVYCGRDDFSTMQSALEARKLNVISSAFTWVPKTTTTLGAAEVEEIADLIERLEDDDDVEAVFCNLEEDGPA